MPRVKRGGGRRGGSRAATSAAAAATAAAAAAEPSEDATAASASASASAPAPPPTPPPAPSGPSQPASGPAPSSGSETAGHSDSIAPPRLAPAAQQASTSTPTPGPLSSTAAAPATTTTRAVSRGAFKLRPKAVRRADEERLALAEQEQKKQSDRVAAEDARLRRINRFRTRGGGRGDMRGGMVRRTVAPSGPFSQLPGSAGSGGRGIGGFGGGGGGGGGGFGYGGGGGGAGHGSSSGFASSSADRPDRISADVFVSGYATLYGSDETKAEQLRASLNLKKGQLLPMAIRREEHKDPEVVVATTAELEAQQAEEDADAESSGESDIFMNKTQGGEGGGADEDNEVWARARKPRKVKLRGEDGKEYEVTDIDDLAERRQKAATDGQQSAPEAPDGASGAATGSNATGGGDARQADLEDEAAQGQQPVKPKRRKRTKKMDTEDLVVQENLRAALEDLWLDPQPKDGRVYLFQFPPVLPPLHAVKANPATAVKNEPDDDVVMLDSVAPKGPGPTVDLTGGDDGSKVKKEEEADGESKLADKNSDGRADPLGGEAGGYLGTMKIRKSGKVELSWGGLMFEVGHGMNLDFVQTAVLLEEADEKRRPGDVAATGKAYGMGPVRGKYNCVPVFRDEEAWVVRPDELEME